jgi:4-aminobutyrate aminotransferase-like enzyme
MPHASVDALVAQRKKYLFPTQQAMYREPLLLTKARGCRVWDSEGREYLDAFGGVVTISLGHNHPEIKARLRAMLDNDELQHTTHLYFHPYLEELAEKLLAHTPGPLSRAYFTNSGSEANELAILAARLATGEQLMISLGLSYHGGTAATLGLCGDYRWKFSSQAAPAVAHAAAPYCYRCPYGATPQHCNLACADDVKRVVEQCSSGRVAGIIVEPILGVGGVIAPPLAYHRRVYDIIHSYGGKYISDEVQTGVGRTGLHFFAIAESGVSPDLITSAKGLGNGAAIGAVLSDEQSAEAMRGKLHFNTFGGDPYATMQASVVLDEIARNNIISSVHEQGNRLKEGLLALAEEFPMIGEVRGRGLMLGIELVEDRISKKPAPGAVERVLEASKENLLLIGRGGIYGNVLRIAPPLTISGDEVDELLVRLKRSFYEHSWYKTN